MQHICQLCGTVHSKWSGQCDGCGEWNSLAEERLEQTPKGLNVNAKSKAIAFTALDSTLAPLQRVSCGIGELDRVLGGGLVPGSAILIGGDPGIGKSTLLLQMVAKLGAQGVQSAYISGEESIGQLQMRGQRLGLPTTNVQVATANSVGDIIAGMEKANGPRVAIIDSIQTMYVDGIDSAPGTVTQVRSSSNELIKLAKRRGMAVILVGHVTKDGQIAGPRVMEHMVDTVLYFEGDRGHPYRILRAVKNRFGATDEIGVFHMTQNGLETVDNPSALFLNQRGEAVSGSVVFAGLEGSRPILTEIQALVAPTPQANPRRAVVGWDSQRLAMVLAVLETRCGVKFYDKEVYLNVAGGLRISEPAADLAVAAALLSAVFDAPIASDTVIFGEIGLSAEVRPVGRSDLRLKEAHKLGFKLAVGALEKPAPMAIRPITQVQELVAFIGKNEYQDSRLA